MLRLLAGQVIDGFTLVEPLHRGGMALLWRVTHTAHRQPLLMKVPLIAYGEGPGAIVGFEVEQMILPRLSGPHVPRFVASADFSRQPYIVMEHLPGRSLFPLYESAPLDAVTVADIGARVATALHDVHRQHVIHFDLKPANVMRRESGEAVLIDFGLSRHDQLPDLLAEEFRLPVGTAPYLSPEQVMGDRSDPRSDTFALGVMLYLFATGTHPFGERESARALRKRLYREPAPPPGVTGRHPALTAGGDPALPRGRSGPPLRHGGAGGLRSRASRRGAVERACRTRKPRLASRRAKRWLRALVPPPRVKRSVARHLADAPIIMAAVDLSPEMQELAEALRNVVRRVLELEPKARVACVNVLKRPRIGIDFGEDEQGRSLHVLRLVALKHWARPLGLGEGRVTYTVLESPEPAGRFSTMRGRLKSIIS